MIKIDTNIEIRGRTDGDDIGTPYTLTPWRARIYVDADGLDDLRRAMEFLSKPECAKKGCIYNMLVDRPSMSLEIVRMRGGK